MQIHFYKYQGCGNDFILIDNRIRNIHLNTGQIKDICNRHFGIGADGLMLLENANGYDFKMVYYNSDGNESSMCGNGGRCITAFAQKLGIIQDKASFIAIDGPHICTQEGNVWSLQMCDVNGIEQTSDDTFFLNTGSPHVVKWVKDVKNYPVFEEGRKIRNSSPYKEQGGTNVNFIERQDDHFFVRTYERGVENETLSCGTGVTASALVVAHLAKNTSINECPIISPGGTFKVRYKKQDDIYTGIHLIGAAEFVFDGEMKI